MWQISPVIVHRCSRRIKHEGGLLGRAEGHQDPSPCVRLWLGRGCDGPDGGEGRRSHLPEEFFQRFPELPPHQAVQDGVQAAVGVRQAHGHGEDVHLRGVVLVAEVDHVEFDEDAPGGERLVGQPAEEEGQHHYGDGLGDLGASLGAGGVDVLGGDEAQEEQVAGGDDAQRHHEAQQHFLRVIEPEPELCAPVGFGEFHEAQVLVGDADGRGEDRVRQRGGDSGEPDEDRDAARRAAVRPPPPALQRGGQRPVPGHAHGCEEKHAGVHVHGRHIGHDLAHGFAEEPSEVQRVLHRPERQSQHELEIGHRQTCHEQVDGGFLPHAFGLHQVQNQQVPDQTERANQRVNDRDDNPHDRGAISHRVRYSYIRQVGTVIGGGAVGRVQNEAEVNPCSRWVFVQTVDKFSRHFNLIPRWYSVKSWL